MVADWLAERFPEVEPREFYRELFPQGELDALGAFTPGKYCGIAVQVVGRKAKRYTVTDELSVIDKLLASNDFCVMSPVSYAGKTQRQDMARFLYSVTFDVDGLLQEGDRQVGLEDFFDQTEIDLNGRAWAYAIPLPTYVVASGTGIHAYYFLEKPIPLFKNVLEQLRGFRHALTKKIWNSTITEYSRNVQYESVTQGFRMVGSVAKDGKSRTRAFKTGNRYTIEELNRYVLEQYRVKEFAYKSDLHLEDAKRKYPDWYQSRIVEGKPKGTWTCKRDLYDWWKRKLEEGAVDGHRYFCLMALAIYARKSGIDYEELSADALGYVKMLNDRGKRADNPFTEDDAMKALEAYSADYITFPRDVIEELTAISIPKNKRNFRKLETHVKILNGTNAIKRSLGEQIGGKPCKREMVERYFAMRPSSTVRQAATALKISKTTVQRWKPKG